MDRVDTDVRSDRPLFSRKLVGRDRVLEEAIMIIGPAPPLRFRFWRDRTASRVDRGDFALEDEDVVLVWLLLEGGSLLCSPTSEWTPRPAAEGSWRRTSDVKAVRVLVLVTPPLLFGLFVRDSSEPGAPLDRVDDFFLLDDLDDFFFLFFLFLFVVLVREGDERASSSSSRPFSFLFFFFLFVDLVREADERASSSSSRALPRNRSDFSSMIRLGLRGAAVWSSCSS
jgi:hypothetical protein